MMKATTAKPVEINTGHCIFCGVELANSLKALREQADNLEVGSIYYLDGRYGSFCNKCWNERHGYDVSGTKAERRFKAKGVIM